MSPANRSISTVADVSLALFLIVAAMGVLVAFVEPDPTDHDPVETDHTAQTLAGSTMNTTYTVSEAVDAHYRNHRTDSNPYDVDELTRISHGPVAAQIADIAVANVTVDGELLTKEAVEYEQAVDEQLQALLVGSQFETHVSARWQPFDGSHISGEATLGQHPPPDADVSTTTITVSSGIPEARDDARDAVDGEQDYDAVARVVANATVEGYLPELASQRALESTGLDYHLTTYRYKRLAVVVAGEYTTLQEEEWLRPSSANTTAANEFLRSHLTAALSAQLDALHGERYDSAGEAARAVSTGHVTLTVRTWTHE